VERTARAVELQGEYEIEMTRCMRDGQQPCSMPIAVKLRRGTAATSHCIEKRCQPIDLQFRYSLTVKNKLMYQSCWRLN